MEVRRSEIMRYLGYHGVKTVSPDIEHIIEECVLEMDQGVTPRHVIRRFPICWHNEGQWALEFAGINVVEGNLSRNLTGCHEIIMLAATLGPAPDRLVKRAELRETFRAMVYQATGAAMIESYVDQLSSSLKQEAESQGLYLRPRFSPGYGDFPLEVQRDFERILEMPRTLGVALSESLLMTPTKSVTAVIGVSREKGDCYLAGCEVCAARDRCEYSRVS